MPADLIIITSKNSSEKTFKDEVWWCELKVLEKADFSLGESMASWSGLLRAGAILLTLGTQILVYKMVTVIPPTLCGRSKEHCGYLHRL